MQYYGVVCYVQKLQDAYCLMSWILRHPDVGVDPRVCRCTYSGPETRKYLYIIRDIVLWHFATCTSLNSLTCVLDMANCIPRFERQAPTLERQQIHLMIIIIFHIE